MSFTFACFISYPHSESKKLTAFVSKLRDALTDEVALYLTTPLFLDRDIEPGDAFRPLIARSICESVCMLVVYVPVYERKTFCLQEFVGMEDLERTRFAMNVTGLAPEKRMIIPIVLRGEFKDLPDWIKGNRHYLDATDLGARLNDAFRSRKFELGLATIAKHIVSIYRAFEDDRKDPCGPCQAFNLPDASEARVVQRLRGSTQPLPLREPGR